MPDYLAWRRVDFTSPVSPEHARSVMLGLATIAGNPRIVLEVHASDHRVAWRVGADESALTKVRAVLRAQIPDVRITPTRSTFADADIDHAASVAVPHSRTLPLRHDPAAVEQVTRQLFDVLASTGRTELVRLQLILGPRTTPKIAPVIDGISRSRIEGKFGEYGFGCALRIAARSGHEARARTLINGVAAAFHVLDVPGMTLRLRGQGRRAVHDVRTPFFWPLWLSVDDLVPLMGWPVASENAALPGLPPRHPKLMPATAAHGRDGRPVGHAADAALRGSTRVIAQPDEDALRHTHVLGLNGTGKSTLLGRLILHDLNEGRGAVLIDPKGDLVDDILARVPTKRLRDIVLLDARHQKPVGINPLVGSDPDLAADSILTVFHALFADSWGPRTADILHAAVLTLARRGDASLVMVPLLLTNTGFRRSVVRAQAAADPLGLGTFWATYESWSDAERAQAIQPLMNKLRTVLLRPTLRGIFGQRSPKFDLHDVFTGNKVLLVALGKGIVGIEGARLLGSLVTTQLWHTILGRIATPPADRTPINVYIDEVQDYIAGLGDLADALATARGYGVGFTVAHQELSQLGPHKSAVLANARSRIVFQTSPADARELATGFGAGDLDREDFRALGAFQAYAQLLTDNTLAPWVSVAAQAFGPTKRSRDILRRAATDRYGADLDDVERDLLTITQTPPERPGGDRRSKDAGGAPRPSQDHADAPSNAPVNKQSETFGRRRSRPRTNPTNDPKGGTS